MIPTLEALPKMLNTYYSSATSAPESGLVFEMSLKQTDPKPENMVTIMLQSTEKWNAVSNVAAKIMNTLRRPEQDRRRIFVS